MHLKAPQQQSKQQLPRPPPLPKQPQQPSTRESSNWRQRSKNWRRNLPPFRLRQKRLRNPPAPHHRKPVLRQLRNLFISLERKFGPWPKSFQTVHGLAAERISTPTANEQAKRSPARLNVVNNSTLLPSSAGFQTSLASTHCPYRCHLVYFMSTRRASSAQEHQ